MSSTREEVANQSLQIFERFMTMRAHMMRSRRERIWNAFASSMLWAHSRFRARIHPIVTVSSKRYYIGYFSFMTYIIVGGLSLITFFPTLGEFTWLGSVGLWTWMLLVSHGRNKEVRMLGLNKCYCGHKENSHWKRMGGLPDFGMSIITTRCGLCRCEMFYNRGDKQYPLLKEKELNKLWRAF